MMPKSAAMPTSLGEFVASDDIGLCLPADVKAALSVDLHWQHSRILRIIFSMAYENSLLLRRSKAGQEFSGIEEGRG